MMLRRRIAKPTFSSTKKPSSSGPRWVIVRFMRANTSPWTRQSRFLKKIPQIPHITELYSLDDLNRDSRIDSAEHFPNLTVHSDPFGIVGNHLGFFASNDLATENPAGSSHNSPAIPFHMRRIA